jgi:ABC-type Fe3+-citrate transport system substrate-binding protein
MGKKTKEHKKKVAKRNEKIAAEKKKFQKQYTQLLEQKLKEYQAKLTENEQLENELKVTLGGQELGFSVVDPSELENNVEPESQNEN